MSQTISTGKGTSLENLPILIVGTGPAALLAADHLSAAGQAVQIFERRPAPGWKLLVAGSSGLNVSHDGQENSLSVHYTRRQAEVAACLAQFGRSDWLSTLEGLGEETFLGTSRRYFLKNKKATSLLAAWIKRLSERGLEFFYSEELVDFQRESFSVVAKFASGKEQAGSRLLLALGSPSWEKEAPLWPQAFLNKGIEFTPFSAANCGYEIDLPRDFFAKAQGEPIKGLTLSTALGRRTGECMITHYGLEGTPVYTMGCPGEARLDLKPDMELAPLTERLRSAPPRSRLKAAKLSRGAELLLLELQPEAARAESAVLAKLLKDLPLVLARPRPLTESISASGGVSWDELNANLELKKMSGVFCAGEMVDWDAPTGGFLIQASVSMGAVAAAGILASLRR